MSLLIDIESLLERIDNLMDEDVVYSIRFDFCELKIGTPNTWGGVWNQLAIKATESSNMFITINTADQFCKELKKLMKNNHGVNAGTKGQCMISQYTPLRVHMGEKEKNGMYKAPTVITGATQHQHTIILQTAYDPEI